MLDGLTTEANNSERPLDKFGSVQDVKRRLGQLDATERLPRWRGKQVSEDDPTHDPDVDEELPRKTREQAVRVKDEGGHLSRRSHPSTTERLPRWRNEQALENVGREGNEGGLAVEELLRKRERVLENIVREENEEGYRQPRSERLPRWRSEPMPLEADRPRSDVHEELPRKKSERVLEDTVHEEDGESCQPHPRIERLPRWRSEEVPEDITRKEDEEPGYPQTGPAEELPSEQVLNIFPRSGVDQTLPRKSEPVLEDITREKDEEGYPQARPKEKFPKQQVPESPPRPDVDQTSPHVGRKLIPRSIVSETSVRLTLLIYDQETEISHETTTGASYHDYETEISHETGSEASLSPSPRCPTCQSISVNSRNLVIFVDGMSSRNKIGPKNTNVTKLFDEVKSVREDSKPEQHILYLNDVGDRDDNHLSLQRRVGRAVYSSFKTTFTWSLKKNVKNAYRWLTRTYRRGDQIYLFGFSRGAYQVRMLASMIHEVGLVKEVHDVEPAYRCYFATDPNKLKTRDKAMQFKKNFCWPGTRIHFVGIWDTVSSLDLIKRDLHITAPRSVTDVCHFRHALILDERRVKFMPDYFAEVSPHSNIQSARPTVNDAKEVWFASSHSDVGVISQRHVEEVPQCELVPRYVNDEDDNPYIIYAGKVSFLWMRRDAASNGLVFNSEETAGKVEDEESLSGNKPLLEILRAYKQRRQCEILYAHGRINDAVESLMEIANTASEVVRADASITDWLAMFTHQCISKLERIGDQASNVKKYDEAITAYSTALSLSQSTSNSVSINSASTVMVDGSANKALDMTPRAFDILIKRSKVRVLVNSWEEALRDADEVINLDPSCHRGYEMRHAALHSARRHAEADEAFNTMLSKLSESPDPDLRQLRHGYVVARNAIRSIVKQTISLIPRMFIDTTTGHLCEKQQQAEAFEELPTYSELVSSMAIQLDDAHIRKEVKEFYRYVMLSHRWENGEPLLQAVEKISIYDLKGSPANTKLQKFCTLVRTLGFRWAWTDTSCVDKSNNVILQEALVAMFAWYRGSSLTVVYLRDVSSKSQQHGDLRKSVWNTRVWTYQEYVAADVVRFYTEDWEPYLGLTFLNHKEYTAIVSEMQQTTEVSAQQLIGAMGASEQEMTVLCPGLDRVREKLWLASRRETTLVEDIAYSLFGIFNVAIPVIYGEGNRAVGRLLEHVLTGSGDVTILAWTGSPGSYNSCLPADLTVYSSLVPPHVPRPIKRAQMDRTLMELRSSLTDLTLVTTLYNRLRDLPSPSLTSSRLKLPSLVFPLNGLVRSSKPGSRTNLSIYQSATSTFGNVEIETADDLTRMKGLCLIHPWVCPILDQEFLHDAALLDEATQALQFITRLRQPFGALLFETLSRVEHRRVAADSLIMVQFRKEVSLTEFLGSIRTIDIK